MKPPGRRILPTLVLAACAVCTLYVGSYLTVRASHVLVRKYGDEIVPGGDDGTVADPDPVELLAWVVYTPLRLTETAMHGAYWRARNL